MISIEVLYSFSGNVDVWHKDRQVTRTFVVSKKAVRQLNTMRHICQAVRLGNSTLQPAKRVLNAGSGPKSARQLHPAFRRDLWEEVRLDVDPEANPDVVSSLTDMRRRISSQSFDAVWSSHSLEHLHAHEVPVALSEFKRVLKPDGFALITSPDLESIASLILERGLSYVAYTSPMGPITSRDMLFGHAGSIAQGKIFMAHNTGFTCASLGQLLVESGFGVVLAKRERLDLWALALMEKANKNAIQSDLSAAGLDMFDDPE
jgi:Methyltransferase domain